MPKSTRYVGWLLFFIGGCLGCGGSQYADVRGQIRLDNEPLAGAAVVFTPEAEGGRPSFGKTNENGEYVLAEHAKLQGAMFGSYVVRISTYAAGKPDEDPPIPSTPERVPSKYNYGSDLRREVKPGEENRFDFELMSDGPIVQEVDDF